MISLRFAIAALLLARCVAQIAPSIASISPAAGPEGTRVEVRGMHLGSTRQVLFGAVPALFQVRSDSQVVALVPMHAPSTKLALISQYGRTQSPSSFRVENDPRVPDEVRYKTGYIAIVPRPPNFNHALLWGIAIADTRVASHGSAQVEIAFTELSCRIDERDVLLNRDVGKFRGGLYLRNPWFSGNTHEPMPRDPASGPPVATIPVGRRPDRIWHFWSASGRAAIPTGHLEGCTARARVRISPGALLQLGMDYWRDKGSLWAPHERNNHEAGATRWYFSSPGWQDVVFTDVPEHSSPQ